MLGVFHLFPVPEMGAPQNSTLNNHDRTTHNTSLCRSASGFGAARAHPERICSHWDP